MKYFYLNHEFDSKIVGIESQIQTFDKFGPSPYLELPQEGPIEFEVEFPFFQMEKRAKRTDFVCNVPIDGKFLTISPKALEVFKELNIDSYQTYPIKVKHKDEVFTYIALYLTHWRQREYIDWENCEFGFANRSAGYLGFDKWEYLEYLRFKSWEEYHDKVVSIAETPNFVIRCLKLVYVRDIPFDLFKMKAPIARWRFCSEKFKQTVEREDLTGFRFEEIVNNVF